MQNDENNLFIASTFSKTQSYIPSQVESFATSVSLNLA